jgi:hypothetical protein
MHSSRTHEVDDYHATLLHELERQIAYTIYAIKGEQAVELEGWPETTRTKLKFETRALINRFDADLLWAAELRAREALASEWQHKDYSGLSSHTQNTINHVVGIVLRNAQRSLEGCFSPLAPSRAAELSPERRTM